MKKKRGNPQKAIVKLTDAAMRFVDEMQRQSRFAVFVMNLSKSTDEKAKAAAEILDEFGKKGYGDQYKGLLKGVEENSAVKALFDFHIKTFFEMILCRGVDNFLTYISQLLALIFISKPETLRSSDKVRVDYVLQHPNMEELIKDLVERRVNDLSYQGMHKLNKHLAEEIGLQLIPDGPKLNKIVRLIECRNIIVHNRGIVNKLFLSRVLNSKEKLGDSLDLDSPNFFMDQMFLAEQVENIDSLAAKKFSLPLVKLKKSD